MGQLALANSQLLVSSCSFLNEWTTTEGQNLKSIGTRSQALLGRKEKLRFSFFDFCLSSPGLYNAPKFLSSIVMETCTMTTSLRNLQSPSMDFRDITASLLFHVPLTNSCGDCTSWVRKGKNPP